MNRTAATIALLAAIPTVVAGCSTPDEVPSSKSASASEATSLAPTLPPEEETDQPIFVRTSTQNSCKPDDASNCLSTQLFVYADRTWEWFDVTGANNPESGTLTDEQWTDLLNGMVETSMVNDTDPRAWCEGMAAYMFAKPDGSQLVIRNTSCDTPIPDTDPVVAAAKSIHP